jgi:hypothetical protein
MKKLFEVNNDEIKRILTLHESRTKSQYLNVISEQNKTEETYTLKSDYKLTASDNNVTDFYNDLKLYRGTVFNKKGNNLVAKTNYGYVDNMTGELKKSVSDAITSGSNIKGNVTFDCSQGKFYITGNPNYKWYDKTKQLTNQLLPVCQNRVNKFTQQKSGSFSVKAIDGLTFKDKNGNNTFSIFKGEDINYINNTAKVLSKARNSYITFKCPQNFTAEFDTQTINIFPENFQTLSFFQNKFCGAKPKEVKQDESQQKSNFTALYTIQNNHDLGKVKVNSQDIVIKSFKYPDYAAIMRGNTPIAYYNCKTNTWGDVEITDTKGLLTGTIKEKVCPQVLTPTTVTADTSTQQVVNTKSPQVNRQQQFVQQVKTYNTQIQTSLGVQKPTGQITDADLDNILTKLS